MALIFVGLLAILAGGGLLKMWLLAIEWTALLLVVAGVILIFVIVLSLVSEWYYKRSGIRYTSLLKAYQKENL